MTLGWITFLAPLSLFGLLGLPLIWWVLRTRPPRPTPQIFPPFRILQTLEMDEETPAKTPFWLLLFRLCLVALIAVALAQPVLQSTQDTPLRRPTLIIDQSAFSAAIWPDILTEAERITKEARRHNLPVQLILSAQKAQKTSQQSEFLPAAEALDILKTSQPVNYVPTPLEIAPDILADSDVYYLSSGFNAGLSEGTSFALPKGATLFSPTRPKLILPGDIQETATGFSSAWHRPSLQTPLEADIQALGKNGRVIAAQKLQFLAGEERGDVQFTLPPQLRAKITQLRVTGLRSAASTYLLDDLFGRPLIGILRSPNETASPLLSESFYTHQALSPHADIFQGDLDSLLPLQPSILIMPDNMRGDGAKITEFIDKGGVLIRFAGPRLASRSDQLLPVRLRQGGRNIGGALAWESPQKLAAFTSGSPFYGLSIPEDVTISKQVMAEPGIETDTRTWARLEDGSPIITATERGQGHLILFHVSAGPDWSNLPLSGLYMDMLRRLLPLAKGQTLHTNNSTADWVIERELDGFGQLQAPKPSTLSVPDAEFMKIKASKATPPGYYRQATRTRALSVISNPESVKPITAKQMNAGQINAGQINAGQINKGVTHKSYGQTSDRSIMGWLLKFAVIALALDSLLSLVTMGRLRRLSPWHLSSGRLSSGRPRMALIVMIGMSALTTLPHPPSYAQTINENQTGNTDILKSAIGLHLAYIKTGDARRDALSQRAMEGLSEQLIARTTIEPVGINAVTPETDALELYPFLYWPVRRDSPALSPAARLALNRYMGAGGTIIFDTADEGERALRAGDPHPGLARITEGLDIPRLGPVPTDHVLTKSFYLLQVFAGRWANGPVYVQSTTSGGINGRDGVSPVIIGSQDWAAGWAQTRADGAMVELYNDIPRQREMAMRFGVNLAMYTLSGNYKADQVHAKALVERLGGRAPAQAPPLHETPDTPDPSNEGPQ